MSNLSKSLLLGVAATIFAAPALAQQGQTDPVYVDQLQLGNIWTGTDLKVQSAREDVVASAVASSNTATALVDDGPLSARISQSQDGAVDARANISARDVGGQIISSANASGNSATAANWYGSTDANIRQDTWGDVSAQSSVDAGWAGAVVSQSTAVANVAQVESDGPQVWATIDQDANSNVYANSQVWTDNAGEFVQNVSIAAGNSADVHVIDSEANIGAIQTTAEHTSVVSTASTQVTSAPEVITSVNAAGNQLNTSATDSWVTLGREGQEVFQGNGSNVYASADTNVERADNFVTSAANGVGNSLTFSGLESNARVDAIQSNSGSVGTDVHLNVGDLGGGIGLASATSIGNSFSAIGEGGSVGGSIAQTSYGQISANANTHIGQAGTVVGTSTAIGNSATFSNRTNNNGQR